MNDGLAIRIFQIVRGIPKSERVEYVKLMINANADEVREILSRGERLSARLPPTKQKAEH